MKIHTPMGTFEQRQDLECTSWESEDMRTWIHVLRFGVDDPMETPWYVIVDDGGEAPRVFFFGSSFEGASDVEIVREIFSRLGTVGAVTSGEN